MSSLQTFTSIAHSKRQEHHKTRLSRGWWGALMGEANIFREPTFPGYDKTSHVFEIFQRLGSFNVRND
jgi:hypothetical protein